MILHIIWCLTFLFALIYGFYKVDDIFNYKRYRSIDIIQLFEYFLVKSYEVTYQNDLIFYITNNQSIPKEQNETIERNFVKKCIMYMGSKNMNMFKRFFGSEQTMCIHMISYLRKRINEDGLSKILNTQSEPSK